MSYFKIEEIYFLILLLCFRHNRLDCCRKLQRTWSIGSNYSQHNPLEPDEIDISDPTRRTAFSITDDDGFIDDELFDV